MSPEQKERMAVNKIHAESKRIAATVGAEKLGPSWVKALLSEFKQPYIKEVDLDMNIYCSKPFFNCFLFFAASCICEWREKEAHSLSPSKGCLQLDIVLSNSAGMVLHLVRSTAVTG